MLNRELAYQKSLQKLELTTGSSLVQSKLYIIKITLKVVTGLAHFYLHMMRVQTDNAHVRNYVLYI